MLWSLFAFLALSCASALAQQANDREQVPAARSTTSSAPTRSTTSDNSEPAPQEDTAANPSDTTAPADPWSKVVVPVEITGQPLPAWDVGYGPVEKTKMVRGGLGFSTLYDDNVFNQATNAVHDIQYSVSPEISIEDTGRRATWNLQYTGGMTFDQRFTNTDVFAHNLLARLSYQLSPHLQMNLQQSYRVSSNPFLQLSNIQSGNLNAPSPVNSWGITPTATRKDLNVGGDFQWQPRPHTTLGFGGGYSTLRFANAVADFSLIPSNSAALHAYYGQQVSARQTLGVAAEWQNLDFVGYQGSARTRTLDFFYLIKLTPSLLVSLHCGPQLTHEYFAATTVPGGYVRDLSAAGGASIVWHRPNFGIQISYDSGVSDGAGLSQAVQVDSFRAEVRSHLTRKWDLSAAAGVGNNKSLTDFVAGLNRYRTISETISLQRQLSANFWFSAQYEHVQQLQVQTGLPDTTVHRNGYQAGVFYRFAFPWGS